MFAKSNFRATLDPENECQECLQCFDIYPTKAILTWPDDMKERNRNFDIYKDPYKGCGLCSTICPTNHIILEKVQDEILEKRMPETYKRYAKERYR